MITRNASQADKETIWSTDQWEKWVRERVEKRLSTFRNEPGAMLGAYQGEQSCTDDYRGRELLELLQNADDAGIDFGPNKVLIECWDEGLYVANTGRPFSSAGIESLMISNLSP